jgi:excisionase family DNA binding protein
MQNTYLDELLTVQEAAEYLKVPTSWIYERTRTRAIPVRKIGRHCRIPRDEFLAWIEQQGNHAVQACEN